MTDEERGRWLEAIGSQVDLLQSGAVVESEVAALLSLIIARMRETSYDTRWLSTAIRDMATGLNQHRNAAQRGECDPAGLRLALHSGVRTLLPLDRIEPEFAAPDDDIDKLIAACAELGIADRRSVPAN